MGFDVDCPLSPVYCNQIRAFLLTQYDTVYVNGTFLSLFPLKSNLTE